MEVHQASDRKNERPLKPERKVCQNEGRLSPPIYPMIQETTLKSRFLKSSDNPNFLLQAEFQKHPEVTNKFNTRQVGYELFYTKSRPSDE